MKISDEIYELINTKFYEMMDTLVALRRMKMEITDEQFFDLFNSKVFGGVHDTIIALKKMEMAGVLKLSKFQAEKAYNEYYDRVVGK